jgi:hypothetical protein
MWYFEEAERLQRASAQIHDQQIGSDLINGVSWTKNIPYDETERKVEKKSGAWSDQGEALPWEALCGSHERALYSSESGPEDVPFAETIYH